jgi:hypothetical protein
MELLTMMGDRVKSDSSIGTIVEVKGLLGAIGWGANDCVVRVALFTSSEDVYEIDIDDENRGLTNALRKIVVVKGNLSKNQRGMKSLDVLEYWTSDSL